MINIEKSFSNEDEISNIVNWLLTKVNSNANLFIDSKDIKLGDVFIACIGKQHDGRSYIKEAISNGAKAVIYEDDSNQNSINQLVSSNFDSILGVKKLSFKLGLLGNIWYKEPSSKIKIIAITGTNGKTSCVRWIAKSMNFNGIPCGSIGTLGYTLLNDDKFFSIKQTTPDILSLQRILSEMVSLEIPYVAMEASSIGIEQGRLSCITSLEIVGFTNLTRDHLDYHKSIKNYKKAKLELFKGKHIKYAVINNDDEFSKEIIRSMNKSPIITSYGIRESNECNLTAHNIKIGTNIISFNLIINNETCQIETTILGLHNIYNLLLVASILNIIGFSVFSIAKSLNKMECIDGRLQIVSTNNKLKKLLDDGPLVIIDYAHTPDALKNSLESLKKLSIERKGKICCIFGCGGSRDKGKRSLMFQIALNLSNRIIITTDNPRYESPEDIIKQIISGYDYSTNKNISIIIERSEAIMHSIWHSKKEDIILIAGKGHEKYQEIAGKKYFFDDYHWAILSLLLLNNINISIDSRDIKYGDLFIAIKGKNFDGHDYLQEVKDKGASAAIVSKVNLNIDIPQIILGDTHVALKHIAKAWRNRFNIPVILIVGSNGKTTTKEMISLILSNWYGENNYLSTKGNQNNNIGVPLSLFQLRSNHLAAVIEIGMNHNNEIKPLSDICSPNIVIITNAQREHQEHLLSIHNVIKENGSSIHSLSDDGVVIIPGDDKYAKEWNSLAYSKKIIKFGIHDDKNVNNIDVYAKNIQLNSYSTECNVIYGNKQYRLILNVPGMHNLRNSLAAITGAIVLNIPIENSIESLFNFEAVTSRLQIRNLTDKIVLIDDTYNANPDSFEAGIDVLSNLPKKHIVICGDMAEVGFNSKQVHFEIGTYAKKKNIDYLIPFGKESFYAAQGFGEPIFIFKEINEIINFIHKFKQASILIKGSRFMNMENIVYALTESYKYNKLNDF